MARSACPGLGNTHGLHAARIMGITSVRLCRALVSRSFSRPAKILRITSTGLRIPIYPSPNAKFTSLCLHLASPAAANMTELLVLVSDFGHTLVCDLCPGSLRVRVDARRSKACRERAECARSGPPVPCSGPPVPPLGSADPRFCLFRERRVRARSGPRVPCSGPPPLLGATSPPPGKCRFPVLLV